MLTTLRIRNLALVEDLTIEFGPGYNVITGETGAGKSILIGALTLVLGERADRTMIRSGSDVCSVEAIFDVRGLNNPLETYLQENGLEPCENHQLLLKRTIAAGGTNRQFINGSPTTLNVLANLGEWLVDIHGPHEHQSLLHPARQLDILDAFGKLERERSAFAEILSRHGQLVSEKNALIVDERTYAQQLDLLRFQANEIESASLQRDEEEQVEQDYRRASNAAKLLQLTQAALGTLVENEASVLSQTATLGRTLLELNRTDPSAASLPLLHEQAISALHDLQSELSGYADRIDVDPARLAQLEERLNLLHSLKRKYGASLAEVIAFGADARSKLRSLEQRDAELVRINSELKDILEELWQAGQVLTARRRKIIPQLSKAAAQQLADLGFKQSQFDVALATRRERDFDSNGPLRSGHGFDTVEFQFAPNPGEPPHPLRAIASSGELARVMLALKTVLACEDKIPVLVFDEVDANVGGETANAVGQKMHQIAQKRQVLCITHLAQVAAPASAHYVATKSVKAGRTISQITLLERKERVTELARMLGGQTQASRKHAEELLSF